MKTSKIEVCSRSRASGQLGPHVEGTGTTRADPPNFTTMTLEQRHLSKPLCEIPTDERASRT